MPVVKKRNQQTESRLLLESDEPVELPPAEVEDTAVVLQFEQFRQYVPELLEELRDGTLAEPVPVMMDGSTFVVHGDTRSFWVKLWHSSPEQTRIERVQVISCLPSTRGMQLIFEEPDAYDDEADYDDDDEEQDGEFDNNDDGDADNDAGGTVRGVDEGGSV
jgi:hypothetical protein